MIIFITILNIIILIAIFLFINKLDNFFGKSEFSDICLINNKLIIFSKIFHSAGDGEAFWDASISTVDVSTGAVEKRFSNMEYSNFSILGIIEGKIWLYNDQKFCVFDPFLFKMVFDQKNIGQKLPELQGINPTKLFINELENKASFLADNGYFYSINPLNFDIKRDNNNQNEQIIKRIHKVKSNTKFGLKKLTDQERCMLLFENKRVGEDLSFINPDFLRDSFTNKIVEKPDKSIVIIHYQSLERFPIFYITSISNSGKIEWEISQKELEIKNYPDREIKTEIASLLFLGNDLIIVFTSKNSKIVSININKGILNWKLNL